MLSAITSYVSLFIASFLASSFLPMTSESVVVYLALKGYELNSIALVAALGSYLGFCSIYFISYYGREVLIDKFIRIKKSKTEKAKRFFEKYGAITLLFAWFPFFGEGFVVIGGILRMNFIVFSFYAFIGTLLRFLIVAYLAAKL